MKKQCKGDYRGFTNSGEAYYHSSIGFPNDVVGEVYFGLSCGGGGTHGEMSMRWTNLGGKQCPYLHVFDDGWAVLASFSDVLEELAEVGAPSTSYPSITPKEFCEILLKCGFKDNTIRENPNPTPTAPVKTTDDKLAEAEKTLKEIATLWPLDTNATMEHNSRENAARIGNKAVTLARKALGIETMP